MSRNDGSTTQEHARRVNKAMQRRKPDQRIRRTCDRLGMALIELIQERPIDDVTVQQVLDRALVGRSTFYLHYRDKYDLLLSQLEGFLERQSSWLSIVKEDSNRVVPVEEMFAHIGRQNKLYRALADAGRLNDFFDLAQEYFARGIERRLRELERNSSRSSNQLIRSSKRAARESMARASALAGSMLALLRWWIDRGDEETPRAMDELFHRMVWSGLQ